MKAVELKSARQLLGLSVAEAAESIGGVTRRSWNYWENSNRGIPDDVVEKINELLQRRRDMIKSVQEQIDSGDKTKIAIIWYDKPDYCENVLDWRFKQSLAATLCHDYGVKLVLFNPESYSVFTKTYNLEDNPQNRLLWASMEK